MELGVDWNLGHCIESKRDQPSYLVVTIDRTYVQPRSDGAFESEAELLTALARLPIQSTLKLQQTVLPRRPLKTGAQFFSGADSQLAADAICRKRARGNAECAPNQGNT